MFMLKATLLVSCVVIVAQRSTMISHKILSKVTIIVNRETATGFKH